MGNDLRLAAVVDDKFSAPLKLLQQQLTQVGGREHATRIKEQSDAFKRADSVVDTPDSVSVTVGEPGPVRSTATITSVYTWPDRVDDATKSRVGGPSVNVVTTLDLRADEATVRVRTRFDNPSRDHRVRVRLPLPEPAAVSRAECAFAVVERGLTAEGRTTSSGPRRSRRGDSCPAAA